ncbi:MAG: hypothetical protein LBL43_01660, partial [Treponema sp.]|nr:hypothetical protein [Treponema sp.]
AAVSGNNVNSGGTAYGGGVYVNDGTFYMAGNAVISGNTASGYAYGGGVFVGSSGAFEKTGGVIYGVNALAANRNTAGGEGDAAYNDGTSDKRNTTANSGDNLNSAYSGPPGGWE